MDKKCLEIVHKAMRSDLSKIIDWKKSLDLKPYPEKIPFLYKRAELNGKTNEEFWNEIAS